MFEVGPVVFHLYGMMIGLGVLVGGWVASKLTKQLGLKRDEVWESLWWVVGLGLVGARFYHVIDWWDYYKQNLGEILMIWKGGLGIYGGILGGVIGLWWYAKSKEKFRKLLDAVAFGLPLGQAIGRWGNFFNQELYGKPTDLPWGVYIRPENRLPEVWEYERFHPLFGYEALWNVGIWLVLGWVIKKKKIKLGKGELFVMYLGLYGIGRFWLEFFRIENWRIYGVNVAQAISLGLIFFAFLIVMKGNDID